MEVVKLVIAYEMGLIRQLVPQMLDKHYLVESKTLDNRLSQTGTLRQIDAIMLL